MVVCRHPWIVIIYCTTVKIKIDIQELVIRQTEMRYKTTTKAHKADIVRTICRYCMYNTARHADTVRWKKNRLKI
jgi:hypothetical protein